MMGGSLAGAALPRRSGNMLAAAAAGLMLASIVIICVTLFVRYSRRANANDPHPIAVPSATTVALPPTFSVQVEANPESAVFELDGILVGTGKLSRSFPRDGHRHVLRISAPGHETVLVEFDADRPPPAQVLLRPAAAHPVPTVATTATPPTPPTPTATTKPPPTTTGHGKGPGPKGPDGRPKTDNINPWE
jgi:hypothetical protein